MGFRFKAFSWHLVGSASALTLTLGLLYLGWYHWPGWYLADMPAVLAIMIGVDVVLGPLLTFMVADPAKARRILQAMSEATKHGKGAVSLDGRLIDLASIRMAAALIAKADAIDADGN